MCSVNVGVQKLIYRMEAHHCTAFCVLLFLLTEVRPTLHECSIVQYLWEKKVECYQDIQRSTPQFNHTANKYCPTEWDGVSCWPPAQVGESVTTSCPLPLQKHALPPAAVTFFQYCVLANFYWLLVEGLYLQNLLVVTFTQKTTFFWWYTAVGWGAPSVIIITWTLLKHQFDNKGCWDDLDSGFWWKIKIPIVFSIFVNFFIFINIIRIIVLKTNISKVGEKTSYRCPVKSTLLLIPLFGVHYIVFGLLPEHIGIEARLYFELVLGSFQGFVVAFLYCFFNSEVQEELKKRTMRCKL